MVLVIQLKTVCFRPKSRCDIFVDRISRCYVILALGVCTRHTTSPICTRRTTSHQFIWQQTAYVRHSERITNGIWSGRTVLQNSGFPSLVPIPSGTTRPRRAWVQLNCLCTSVGRFHSCLYKWGMASSAACECGTEEQTVDHVVLQCPIYRPPHVLHGLTVQDHLDKRIQTLWFIGCLKVWMLLLSWFT